MIVTLCWLYFFLTYVRYYEKLIFSIVHIVVYVDIVDIDNCKHCKYMLETLHLFLSREIYLFLID